MLRKYWFLSLAAVVTVCFGCSSSTTTQTAQVDPTTDAVETTDQLQVTDEPIDDSHFDEEDSEELPEIDVELTAPDGSDEIPGLPQGDEFDDPSKMPGIGELPGVPNLPGVPGLPGGENGIPLPGGEDLPGIEGFPGGEHLPNGEHFPGFGDASKEFDGAQAPGLPHIAPPTQPTAAEAK